MNTSTRLLVAMSILGLAGCAFEGKEMFASRSAPAQPRESALPLPSTLPLADYEKLLYDFLANSMYDQQPGHLQWARDKGVRDTGDYLNMVDYGTHHAVRIYYSPKIIDWLKGGRVGPIPDGAMMVKEQFPPPAVRYAGMDEKTLLTFLNERTVMVKDSAGSPDGWFWADYYGQPVDSHDPAKNPTFSYPSSGFGQYCVRCHASAEREGTFATTRNIEGFAGTPITYNVDNSWRLVDLMKPPAAVAAPPQLAASHALGTRSALVAASTAPRVKLPGPYEKFVKFFKQIPPVDPTPAIVIPNETYDHIVSPGKTPQMYVTSDQCLSCHGGLGAPYGAMFINPRDGTASVAYNGKGVNASQGVNISQYGEWRWSMMGLAGRDPIFYAQLETEVAVHPQHAPAIVNTCFSCHGAMGQRQNVLDNGKDAMFQHAYVSQQFAQIDNPKDPKYRLGQYGALARDGISCTVCHHMVETDKPLDQLITGNFDVGKPDELFGPYKDHEISTHPMKTGLGVTPKYDVYIKSSRMCASCHVLNVPVYDDKGNQVGTAFEQATYLEWLNSEFDNEYTPNNPKARTCQQCHMPNDYHGLPLRQRIAASEDATYPEVDNRARNDLIQTRFRDDYPRHVLLGVNVFAMQMFSQFNKILGVNTTIDFMTGSTEGLPNAINNAMLQASQMTADVKVTIQKLDLAKAAALANLVAEVRVTNKTGHRFPTGVGFRRAFLEFQVIDASGGSDRVVWASGRTNELGIIVDQNGTPLPSEFFERNAEGKQQYEPHYTSINAQSQVQIYQELTKDPQHNFTTSFLALKDTVTNNRLLPPGFLEATYPDEETMKDPGFIDGTGSDTLTYRVPLFDQSGAPLIRSSNPNNVKVVATLYYQSIPPFYLQQRFRDAQGTDTKRLYYLTSNLKLEGTGLENWKLKIAQDSARGPAR